MSEILSLVVLLGFIKIICADLSVHPDTGLNIFEYFAKHNCGYQNITIKTKDKYILNTVRLVGKNDSTSSSKGAVLIAHGILSSHKDFLLQGKNSLPLMLQEKGLSVFLMANRGSTYSMQHEYLSPDSEEFWDFSFREIGIYDIPANMDMITKETGFEKMHVITHSQGSTALLVLLCERPEYQQKIISGHLLAPIVYFEYCTLLLINALKYFANEIYLLFKTLKLNKGILTYNPLYTQIGILFCHQNSPFIGLCVQAMGFCGENPTQCNSSIITVLLSNFPAGVSIKSLIYYLQVAKANQLRYFDYGMQNLQVYGKFLPPVYNLRSINARLLIWYGKNDCLSGAYDFERLALEIPTAISKPVQDPNFNHIDFLMANDAKMNVYDVIVDDLCAS